MLSNKQKNQAALLESKLVAMFQWACADMFSKTSRYMFRKEHEYVHLRNDCIYDQSGNLNQSIRNYTS